MAILSKDLLRTFFERSEASSRPEQTACTEFLHATPEKPRLGLSTYVPERMYRTGEPTIYNGILLYAITDTTGAFNPQHWQKIFALGSVTYKGTWNASSNEPQLASGVGTKGEYYIVSDSGSSFLDGLSTWAAGDWVIYNGTAWERVINADESDQTAA